MSPTSIQPRWSFTMPARAYRTGSSMLRLSPSRTVGTTPRWKRVASFSVSPKPATTLRLVARRSTAIAAGWPGARGRHDPVDVERLPGAAVGGEQLLLDVVFRLETHDHHFRTGDVGDACMHDGRPGLQNPQGHQRDLRRGRVISGIGQRRWDSCLLKVRRTAGARADQVDVGRALIGGVQHPAVEVRRGRRVRVEQQQVETRLLDEHKRVGGRGLVALLPRHLGRTDRVVHVEAADTRNGTVTSTSTAASSAPNARRCCQSSRIAAAISTSSGGNSGMK